MIAFDDHIILERSVLWLTLSTSRGFAEVRMNTSTSTETDRTYQAEYVLT